MRIFFDVDYTLLGGLYTLRPWAREVFHLLKRDGLDIYIWSGKGVRKEDMVKHGLDQHVTDYFEKPLWESPVGYTHDYAIYYRSLLRTYGIPITPDFVVDDNADLVRAFDGKRVHVYMDPDEEDDELLQVYDAVTQHAEAKECTPSRPSLDGEA